MIMVFCFNSKVPYHKIIKKWGNENEKNNWKTITRKFGKNI